MRQHHEHTMNQNQFIDQITTSPPTSINLSGPFLAGSFGRGDADQFSDIDLVALIDPENFASAGQGWRTYLATTIDIVFWQERSFGQSGFMLNAISPDWLRIDFVATTRQAFRSRTQDGLKALYDPTNIMATLAPISPPKQPDKAAISAAINEFIRVLGLVHVVVGRGEYYATVAGVGLLRDQLATLMIEASPDHHDGGALHLSKIISQSDMATLRALPFPPPERAPLIKAHIEIARVFFPYAKALADSLDIVWPDAFEQATLDLLKNNFGSEIKISW